jgi:formylglycine-generating enzyme
MGVVEEGRAVKRIALLIPLICSMMLPLSAAHTDSSFRDCPDCPLMALVRHGEFEMGLTPASAASEGDADPVHRVSIEKDFAAGVYTVSRAEFGRFVAETHYSPGGDCEDYASGEWRPRKGANWSHPGFAQTANDPVVCVSWTDTQAYTAWLSGKAGHRYRLLSEAEWEYIASGDRNAGFILSHDAANYGAEVCCNRRRLGRDRWEYTAPVGSFPADVFGLYDVFGNVWEWMQDCFHGDYRGAPSDGSPWVDRCSDPVKHSVRGGSYGDSPPQMEPSYRLRAESNSRYVTLGFRVAR